MEINRISKVHLVNNIKNIEQTKLECKLSHQEFNKISDQHAVLQMTQKEYKTLMRMRPLIKYRPLKNSLTKRVDKSLLAEGLDIPEEDVETYISATVNNNFEEGSMIKLNQDCYRALKQTEIDMMRSYVYRHGNQDEVIAYFDNELENAKNLLKTLYDSMDDSLSGVSSYYSRPCHPLNNVNAQKMHDVITKHLDKAEADGQITKEQNLQAADDTLLKIRKIQNDPDLRQAFKFVWNAKTHGHY